VRQFQQEGWIVGCRALLACLDVAQELAAEFGKQRRMALMLAQECG
jgi:hypothetical protein